MTTKQRCSEECKELQEIADELRTIQEQIHELLRDARVLIADADELTGSKRLPAAESYWIAHVTMAITRDHDYIGGSMLAMDDTIESIEQEVDPC